MGETCSNMGEDRANQYLPRTFPCHPCLPLLFVNVLFISLALLLPHAFVQVSIAARRPPVGIHSPSPSLGRRRHGSESRGNKKGEGERQTAGEGGERKGGGRAGRARERKTEGTRQHVSVAK